MVLRFIRFAYKHTYQYAVQKSDRVQSYCSDSTSG